MLKATAGGGGRGIRMVASGEELADAYERTSQEALRAFGSGVVFLERLVTGARHVEVQVISDGETAWALGVRDCSVQRRNQKIIEESASPVLAPEQTAELKRSAERLAVAVGYRGACTVEFLYHPGEKLFAFLEVNTRLQVEHPITEITTGTDLVRLQLHVAAGGKLTGAQPAELRPRRRGAAQRRGPRPRLRARPRAASRGWTCPPGPGIRVDTGVSEGDTIPADFDSMIAKIIAYGRDRDEALGRLRRAMAETTVIIEGGATNKSFVLDLLDQPEVIDASADTGWIDRVRGEGRLVSHRHSAVALAAAAIEAYEEEERVERAAAAVHRVRRPPAGAARERPPARPQAARRRLPRQASPASAPHRFRVGIEAGAGTTCTPPTSSSTGSTATPARSPSTAAVPPGHRHPRPDPPGRGRRRHPPRQPRRRRRRPLPRARAGRRDAAGGRRRGRGGRADPRAGEHEDGDGAARAVPRPAQGVPGVGRQPGRDRRAAAAARAARRRAPRTRRPPETETVELDLPAEPPGVPAEARVERGLQDLRSLLLGFDVDPHDERRVLADYLAARETELPAAARSPTRSSCCRCSPTCPS